MRQRLPGQQIRWIRAENWHLTIRFLGDISTKDMASLSHFLAEIASSASQVRWCGDHLAYLPNEKRPKVLAVEGDSDAALSRLVEAIWALPVENGEHRKHDQFRPHISLVRFGRDPSAELLLRSDDPLADPFSQQPLVIEFDELALYTSELTPNGSIYTLEGCWSLQSS